MREDTIEICHLKKAYGEHVIFSNLTMELKKGAVTCLMAPSGAGKTTLLRGAGAAETTRGWWAFEGGLALPVRWRSPGRRPAPVFGAARARS